MSLKQRQAEDALHPQLRHPSSTWPASQVVFAKSSIGKSAPALQHRHPVALLGQPRLAPVLPPNPDPITSQSRTEMLASHRCPSLRFRDRKSVEANGPCACAPTAVTGASARHANPALRLTPSTPWRLDEAPVCQSHGWRARATRAPKRASGSLATSRPPRYNPPPRPGATVATPRTAPASTRHTRRHIRPGTTTTKPSNAGLRRKPIPPMIAFTNVAGSERTSPMAIPIARGRGHEPRSRGLGSGAPEPTLRRQLRGSARGRASPAIGDQQGRASRCCRSWVAGPRLAPQIEPPALASAM